MPEAAAPPQGTTTVAAGQARIGEVTVEVAGEKNENVMWGPTKTVLRGRWDWANLARGETSEVGLTKMPVIPGRMITVIPRERLALIQDPLNQPESAALLRTISSVHDNLWGRECVGVEDQRFENLSDPALATWLYWIMREHQAKHVRFIVGRPFTLEDIARDFPRAKIQRQFFDSLGFRASKQPSTATAKELAREVSDE